MKMISQEIKKDPLTHTVSSAFYSQQLQIKLEANVPKHHDNAELQGSKGSSPTLISAPSPLQKLSVKATAMDDNNLCLSHLQQSGKSFQLTLNMLCCEATMRGGKHP